MRIIGLTGGIGTGKSEVAKILQELGAEVISADQLGHEAYRPGTDTWGAVVAAFGAGILQTDGQVDRKKLASLVFSDPSALTRLNAIVHPGIRHLLQARLHAHQEQGTKVAVVEAAVLIEAGWDSLVDEVWVVAASQDEVVRRLRRCGTLTEEQIRQRIKAQISPEERAQHADVVIDNQGELTQLRAQVEALWRERVQRRG